MSAEPVTTTQIVRADPRLRTISDLLQKQRTALAQILPRHLTADRLIRVAVAACSRNPELLKCDLTSLYASISKAAQLGLEPGGMHNHAHLVPFWNSWNKKLECQLIPGFQGLLHLARRNGNTGSVAVRAVYERDSFTYETGLVDVLKHVPFLAGDPGPVRLFYAVSRPVNGGDPQVEVMNTSQVNKIRDNVLAKKKHPEQSPWSTHYEEQGRKTVFKRLAKWLEMSDELAEAIELDNLEGDVLDIPVVVSVDQVETESEKGGTIVDAGTPEDFVPDAAPDAAPDSRTAEVREVVKQKRGPGRPRKNPVPETAAPAPAPTPVAAAPAVRTHDSVYGPDLTAAAAAAPTPAPAAASLPFPAAAPIRKGIEDLEQDAIELVSDALSVAGGRALSKADADHWLAAIKSARMDGRIQDLEKLIAKLRDLIGRAS